MKVVLTHDKIHFPVLHPVDSEFDARYQQKYGSYSSFTKTIELCWFESINTNVTPETHYIYQERNHWFETTPIAYDSELHDILCM